MEGSIGGTMNEDTQTFTATKVQIVFRHFCGFHQAGYLGALISVSSFKKKNTRKATVGGNEIQEMLEFSSFHSCLIETPTIPHLERHLRVFPPFFAQLSTWAEKHGSYHVLINTSTRNPTSFVEYMSKRLTGMP